MTLSCSNIRIKSCRRTSEAHRALTICFHSLQIKRRGKTVTRRHSLKRSKPRQKHSSVVSTRLASI